METHSRQSLYEIHGINIEARRRRGSIAWPLAARILRFLARVKQAIEGELAARQAIAELAGMNDHMLRDIGIVRSEIEIMVRRPRARAGTADTMMIFCDEASPVLPTVTSPGTASEGSGEQALRRRSASQMRSTR
jgi:uncharacterized protein YjiS (DUF1127 family)